MSLRYRSGRPRPWQARFRGPDGRERTASFRLKRDAERWVREQRATLDRGLWVDPVLGRVTLAEWSDRWMATTVHLKEKTAEGYESLLRVHVLPVFGDLELATIDRVAVRQWVAELEVSGLSPSRIRQARQVLGAVLGAAVDAGYLGRNPAKGVKVPRDRRREMLFLSAAQVEDLAAAARTWSTLIYLLAYGGLRWGEAVALRRSRCELLRSRLHIAESGSEVGGRLVFGSTKTYDDRTIIVPGFLRSRLAEHLAARTEPEESALVFTAAQGGPLRHSNFYKRVWRPAKQVAGVPEGLRIHDLRHTCAALLIAQGASPKAIQAHLGHSSIQVTFDRYGHLFPEDLEDLADRLDEARESALADHTRTKRGPEVLELPHGRSKKVL